MTDGVDDLRVEGEGDIEDGLFVHVGEDTVIVMWRECLP